MQVRNRMTWVKDGPRFSRTLQEDFYWYSAPFVSFHQQRPSKIKHYHRFATLSTLLFFKVQSGTLWSLVRNLL